MSQVQKFLQRGYKNIEDIKVGDMVLTHRNRFMPVLRNGGEVDKEIYKLKVQGFLEQNAQIIILFIVEKQKIQNQKKLN